MQAAIGRQLQGRDEQKIRDHPEGNDKNLHPLCEVEDGEVPQKGEKGGDGLLRHGGAQNSYCPGAEDGGQPQNGKDQPGIAPEKTGARGHMVSQKGEIYRGGQDLQYRRPPPGWSPPMPYRLGRSN